jgi:hypothetical protein
MDRIAPLGNVDPGDVREPTGRCPPPDNPYSRSSRVRSLFPDGVGHRFSDLVQPDLALWMVEAEVPTVGVVPHY